MAGLKSQPEFESQDDTETATTTKEKTVTQQAPTAPTVDKAAIAAGLAAATAIAKAATGTAVAEPKAPIKYRKAFEEKANAIPIEDIEQWQLAAPAVTAEQGKAKHSKKGPIGDKFHLRVESFNMRYLAVPGVNDKEAKDKVRNSYDKITISGEPGSSVMDYIDALKAEGYPKAHLEPYVDLWGYITWDAKNGVIADDDQELVRVQLSKTSSANFAYFCGQRGRPESEGKVAKLEVVEITADAQEGKSGSYTNYSFSAPKVV